MQQSAPASLHYKPDVRMNETEGLRARTNLAAWRAYIWSAVVAEEGGQGVCDDHFRNPGGPLWLPQSCDSVVGAWRSDPTPTIRSRILSGVDVAAQQNASGAGASPQIVVVNHLTESVVHGSQSPGAPLLLPIRPIRRKKQLGRKQPSSAAPRRSTNVEMRTRAQGAHSASAPAGAPAWTQKHLDDAHGEIRRSSEARRTPRSYVQTMLTRTSPPAARTEPAVISKLPIGKPVVKEVL